MHFAMSAFEQPVPDHFLQPAHLLAHGGLGGVQPRRSRGEAAAVGDHDDGPQQVQVEEWSIRFRAVIHRDIRLSNGKTDF
ncbi:hypothetical protein D3C78_1619970 [compost metagenome]